MRKKLDARVEGTLLVIAMRHFSREKYMPVPNFAVKSVKEEL